MFLSIHAVTGANIVLVKAWLRRHWQMAHDHAQPEIVLLKACGQVTMEKALDGLGMLDTTCSPSCIVVYNVYNMAMGL